MPLIVINPKNKPPFTNTLRLIFEPGYLYRIVEKRLENYEDPSFNNPNTGRRLTLTSAGLLEVSRLAIYAGIAAEVIDNLSH